MARGQANKAQNPKRSGHQSNLNKDSGKVGFGIPDNSENLDLLYDFTKDIIDKQYRSYVWNDGKVQSLVTIDAAVIGGILLLVQTFKNTGVYPLILLGFAFVVLIISFIICLIHSIPKIHSGIGNESNLRTMIGISQYSKEKYYEQVRKIRIGDILKMNSWQIAGMCKNNLRSHKLIRLGARLTITGVIFLALSIPLIVYEDYSYKYQNITNDLLNSPDSVRSEPYTDDSKILMVPQIGNGLRNDSLSKLNK